MHTKERRVPLVFRERIDQRRTHASRTTKVPYGRFKKSKNRILHFLCLPIDTHTAVATMPSYPLGGAGPHGDNACV